MSLKFQELDLMEIFKDIGMICKTESVCQKCSDKECLIGYARNSAAICRKDGVTYVPNGVEKMPLRDIRGGYDEYNCLHAISHLLLQCKSCKKDHYDNCIISVIRNCLEMIEYGETRKYEGSPLEYMMEISKLDAQKANIIAKEYQNRKKK